MGGNDIALNQSNNSVQSIELQQKAYNSHQANMYNVQRRQTKTKTKTMESNEIQQQGIMIHSNSIGQHALKSVISKYVKNNQHTQRTINHYKSWLKSFQNELRNVSDSISHEKVTHRHHHHRNKNH